MKITVDTKDGARHHIWGVSHVSHGTKNMTVWQLKRRHVFALSEIAGWYNSKAEQPEDREPPALNPYAPKIQ